MKSYELNAPMKTNTIFEWVAFYRLTVHYLIWNDWKIEILTIYCIKRSLCQWIFLQLKLHLRVNLQKQSTWQLENIIQRIPHRQKKYIQQIDSEKKKEKESDRPLAIEVETTTICRRFIFKHFDIFKNRIEIEYTTK